MTSLAAEGAICKINLDLDFYEFFFFKNQKELLGELDLKQWFGSQ